jgi:hypothetical protein
MTGPYERNLIRPDEVTSLPSEGEVQTCKGADGKRSYTKRRTLKNVRKRSGDVIWCLRTERSEARVTESGRPCRGQWKRQGVRASVVVKKRRNGRGAKGGRKMMREEDTKGTAVGTLRSAWKG